MLPNLLRQITPIVLTYNEHQNIGRTLTSLAWARHVVLLDSGSTDKTEETARSFGNVEWFTRSFDSHRNQWAYAIRETGISTEYVLALDADMEVSDTLLVEIKRKFLKGNFSGGLIRFEYRYYGRALIGSLCPPQIRLFRPAELHLTQHDHTQSFDVNGSVYKFRSPLVHDDRKPIERWIAAQVLYQQLNESELAKGGRGRFRDRLRRAGMMPPLAGLIAYLRAGGPFKGAAAARYAYERMTTESILAVRLMDARLQRQQKAVGSKQSTP